MARGVAGMDVNPVLIKEWRQVSRSRFMQGLTIVVLLMLLLASTFNLVAIADDQVWAIAFSPGLLLARMIWLIISVGILAITLDIYVRTSHEWRPAARDLVFTTSLSPARMLTGKFLACLSLNGFVLSLAVPFLLVATRCNRDTLVHGVSLGEILQGMMTVCLLGLFIQGAAVAAAVVDLPRPAALLAGGYLFAFIGWRPIFLRPEQLASLQLFLAGHALLFWIVASFGLLSPVAARHSSRLLWGIPIVLGLAYNDWGFYKSFPPNLQNLLSQVVVLAAAGYLVTLGLLAWVYWRRATGQHLPPETPGGWVLQTERWLMRLARQKEPVPTASPSLAPAVSVPEPPLPVDRRPSEIPWLPKTDRSKPADAASHPPMGAWGDSCEVNPVFIKVMRSLIRQKFFILLPAIVVGFVLATTLLHLVFKHTLVDEWPMYHFFFRTFLLLSLMLFWSMSYEIVHRTLEEWSGKDAATDPIRLSPLGGYRILAGLLLIGLLAMPPTWLATIPSLWFSGLLEGWDPYFWSSIEVLGLAAIAIYLWTLAVSFWDASRLFKTLFSLILFAMICPRALWLAPSLRWDFAGYAMMFAGMAAAGLTTPWRRPWWPPLLHFIMGSVFLGIRGDQQEARLAAAIQIAVFAAAYLQLQKHRRHRNPVFDR